MHASSAHTTAATPTLQAQPFLRPADHELFARHIAESEQRVDVQGLGRTVREWSRRPAKPDNHWLDCLVGCAVAASLAGIRTAGGRVKIRQRKRYSQDDLRSRK